MPPITMFVVSPMRRVSVVCDLTLLTISDIRVARKRVADFFIVMMFLH